MDEQQKAAAILQLEDDARARLHAAADALNADKQELREAERVVQSQRNYRGHRTVRRSVTATGVVVEEQIGQEGATPEALSEVERCTARVRASQVRLDAIRAEVDGDLAFGARLREHLRSQGVDARRLPVAAVPPRTDAAPDLAQLALIRQQRAARVRERTRMAQALRSEVDAIAAIDAFLHERAALPELPVSAFLSAGPVDANLITHESGDFSDLHRARTLEGLFAALSRDAFREFLIARVREEAERRGGFGPSAEARAVRLATLNHEIEQLEIEEEGLVWAAAGHGVHVARRPDTDPRVVLAA